MKRKNDRLLIRSQGASAVEFAFVAPFLFLFIIGLAQTGILFFANTGLEHAVGEGARYATLYPRPTDDQIKARMTERRFGLDPARITATTLTHGIANDRDYIDIEMGYSAPIDFIFFKAGSVNLVERRRVFVQPTT